MNNKILKLAKMIVNESLKVKKSEKVLITLHTTIPNVFASTLIKEIYKNKGIPYIKIIDPMIDKFYVDDMNEEAMNFLIKQKEKETEIFDAFIDIVCITKEEIDNSASSKKLETIKKKSKEIDEIKVGEKRWVLLNYPSDAFAKLAKMSKKHFFDYAMEVMTLDYSYMNRVSKPLKELMDKTDKVKIVGPDTNLEFSIKDMTAISCFGQNNIPDGECFTAPIKTSVNGTIKFNTPTPFTGKTFNNISLTFKNGKVVDWNCDNGKSELTKIINTDEGSCYLGEFAISYNPLLLEPMGNILFDEKIAGSLHIALGTAYKECDNGNKSLIHLDLIQIQRKEYGGGEIYFDNKLIRKDGIFVLKNLKALNYDLDKKTK